MIFVAVEVLPVGSTPPAAAVVRISKGGGHDLGAAAPLSTKAFSHEQGVPEVRCSHRDEPGWQNSYTHALLELQQRRPP